MKNIVIYTDGGCSRNPGGDGAFAAIINGPLLVTPILGYIPAPTTNNRAEIAAVIEALLFLKEEKILDHIGAIEFRCDSMICVNLINGGGMPDHKRKNGDLVRQVRQLSSGLKIRATWVPGHSGDLINERCDQLCIDAIQTRHNAKPQYSSLPTEQMDLISAAMTAV